MIPNMPMPKANISGNNKCSCNTSNIHGSSMQLLATKEQEHRTQSTEPRSTENRESSNQSLKFHAHNLFKDSLNIGQASSAGEIYLHLSLSRKIAKLNCKLQTVNCQLDGIFAHRHTLASSEAKEAGKIRDFPRKCV